MQQNELWLLLVCHAQPLWLRNSRPSSPHSRVWIFLKLRLSGNNIPGRSWTLGKTRAQLMTTCNHCFISLQLLCRRCCNVIDICTPQVCCSQIVSVLMLFAFYAAICEAIFKINVPKEFIVQKTRKYADNIMRSEMACKLLFWRQEWKFSQLRLMATCEKDNSSSLGLFLKKFSVAVVQECQSNSSVLFQYIIMLFLIHFYSFFTVLLTCAMFR